MSAPTRRRDHPPKPGVTLTEAGADVCVYAGHAEGVQLCLFEDGDRSGASERRIPLVDHRYGYWYASVPGLRAGQRYGLRVTGPWLPHEGMRHNPAKLLLDPYGLAVEGEVSWVPQVYGHDCTHDLLPQDHTVRDERDSAAYVPRSVVLDPVFDWGTDAHPRRSLADTVLYEAHVRNLTMRLPSVPKRLRGTYAGLGHPSTVDYLARLGVTAIELLPVHAFTSEPALARRGTVNHWGYNTLGFFAPHAPYAAAGTPQGVLDEFKGMVKSLHSAGIEVILDVVYNHTAEQSVTGPTLSWRGLDARTYYRLDGRGMDIDVTGCGNTLDTSKFATVRMVLDSLRYWVQECHVDGFRFDLAVALGRGRGDEFDADHPFFVALRSDPVLSQVKSIAEPWDLGIHGWRTGGFPPSFSEWNDRFRDRVRAFWLTDVAARSAGQHSQGVRDLATRLAGSADLFHHDNRATIASINFVAAHDGFTAADLTTYDVKHNEINGEYNRDGTDNNGSWNHGTEGPSRALDTARQRAMRNLMGTLLLSTGVPMINGGDEFGRTQRGNNNAYCQDNPVSWFDWALAPWQEDLLETTRFLIRLRERFPVLRQRTFFSGTQVHADGSKDLQWCDRDGLPMTTLQWADPGQRTVSMLLNGAWRGVESLLVVIHGDPTEAVVTLPRPPGLTAYELVWDSAMERPGEPTSVALAEPVVMHPTSIRVYRANDLS
ncbi:MAG: glycogen debranching protein GlgX [Dermatophilaceae bacterium]